MKPKDPRKPTKPKMAQKLTTERPIGQKPPAPLCATPNRRRAVRAAWEGWALKRVWAWFVTLTRVGRGFYTQELAQEAAEEWLNKLRAKHGHTLYALVAIGRKDGRWHPHVVVGDDTAGLLGRRWAKKQWPYGNASVEECRNAYAAVTYLTKALHEGGEVTPWGHGWKECQFAPRLNSPAA